MNKLQQCYQLVAAADITCFCPSVLFANIMIYKCVYMKCIWSVCWPNGPAADVDKRLKFVAAAHLIKSMLDSVSQIKLIGIQ